MLARSSLLALVSLTFFSACSEGDGDVSSTGGTAPSGGTSNGGSGGTAQGATGGTGATTSTGGQVATGGAATGGTPGSGGATGGAATGGSPGTGGGSTGGAATGGTSGGSGECSVCDDFESGTVGMPPDPSKWTTILDYGGNGDSARVVVDATEAHSGSNSVKVQGENGVFGFSPTTVPDTFYLRAWMKVPAVQGTPVLVGIGSSTSDPLTFDPEARLRLFPNGADGATYFAGNDVQDNGLYPDALDGTGCPTCTEVPSEWFCVEMHFDSASPSMTAWIDGTEAVSVPSDSGWNWPTSVGYVRFGVLALGGNGPTIWVDDVAIGDQRLGCD